ncbi:DNA-binding GntR family transcriptional regulator [Azospirillum agricola]|uniref:GntR family transcriptional regulator n=1 Tax=Azospirillum agricola TaxID=1720247 RepID=UPI001AE6799A|nr:GntR family transcriptional regulator [Azospirillum agricola]MBP2231820.1 DNA-binding GntR family transcriptional regulator [Azospirillum agricola]
MTDAGNQTDAGRIETGQAETAPAGFASMADQAYAAIEELIVSGILPPRGFVSEKQLSAQTGIGRTPVREALKRLELDGMVTIVPSRGIMVTEVDVKLQLYVLDVRRELERLIARRAARYALPAERERCRAIAGEMLDAARSEDGMRFMHLDQEVNQLLDQCARNPVATQTIRPLRSLSRRFWFQNHHAHSGSLEDGARTHAELMLAIHKSDVEAAAAASDRLMAYVEAYARETLRYPFADHSSADRAAR